MLLTFSAAIVARARRWPSKRTAPYVALGAAEIGLLLQHPTLWVAGALVAVLAFVWWARQQGSVRDVSPALLATGVLLFALSVAVLASPKAEAGPLSGPAVAQSAGPGPLVVSAQSGASGTDSVQTVQGVPPTNFREDFGGASFNSSVWNVGLGWTQTGGVARQVISDNWGRLDATETSTRYDLEGGSIVWDAAFPNTNTYAAGQIEGWLYYQAYDPVGRNAVAGFGIIAAASGNSRLIPFWNDIAWPQRGNHYWDGNAWQPSAPAGGIDYDPTAQRYLRVRESGGTMIWEASPNGTAWTELASDDIPGDVRFQGGYFGFTGGTETGARTGETWAVRAITASTRQSTKSVADAARAAEASSAQVAQSVNSGSPLSFSPLALLLVGVGTFGATCAVTLRLAAADPDRLFLLPATLLALAAFVPAGVAIWGGGRETLGTDDAELNRVLIAVYLLGVFTTFLLAPKVVGRGRDARILWIVVLYWVTGAVANVNAGLPMARLAFLIVPVIFIVAWRYPPSYDDALSLLGFVSLAVCGASLLLALDNPSNAFFGPARVADILGPHRLAGILEQPNGLGLFAAIGVLVWWRREGWLRVLGLSVCGLVLVASDSRTAWFACAAAVIVLVVGKRHTARPFSRGQLVVGASLLTLAASLILILGARGELGPITFTGRTEIWQFVAERWDESPFLGHGLGAWSSLISHRQVPVWWGQAHDQFFQSLYTTGLLGVGLLLLLVWYWTAANLRFARDGYMLPLALEALVAVDALFESPLSLGGVGDTVLLLSILLFLRPSGSQLVPASATSVDYGLWLQRLRSGRLTWPTESWVRRLTSPSMSRSDQRDAARRSGGS